MAASTSLELVSEHACFGGKQRFYKHDSSCVGLPMRFSVFLPAAAMSGDPVPALIYLAGLTCNEETFMTKAGAQRRAAELGIALIAPDTSPRGAGITSESDAWDFGLAASFYLDATQEPWAKHYRMETYLARELPAVIGEHLPVDVGHLGLFGHSMGGHGALTLALRHPGLFKSLSALAPICAPTQCPWGHKAFSGYLGSNQNEWLQHDATALMGDMKAAPHPEGILIDQGLADKFLEVQLHPHLFEAACASVDQPITIRRHVGYDHGYYFISTFVNDHLDHHAQILKRA